MNLFRHLPIHSSKLVALLVICTPASALEFTKCLAFSKVDSVRVEVHVKPDAATDDVELAGRITSVGSSTVFWQGSLGKLRPGGAPAELSHTISNLKPELWEPATPTLYNLQVTATKDGKAIASRTVRIGFRSFEVRDGQFHLNGRPVFLRGIAINPPKRTIPADVGESRAFAESYVRYLKSQNVNIFRLNVDESQVWFDVCDELGVMLYAGRYASPPGGDAKRAAPENFDQSIADYKKLFEGYASHPSIVMYLLANELPVSGAVGEKFSALLTRASAELKRWDPTRPCIGNAGFGEGREGDVCDVHRYWGWYYNSFLTYYNLRDKLVAAPLFGDPVKNQPITFTECVGAFTGSSGEFNVVRKKQLAPRLGWIGHTEEPREDALRYQSFITKQATESFRRMRPLNPRLAGIMPFSIFFYNWSGISSFEQMKPKPAMEQLGISYQPVLLSWEMWTPQVYAGTSLRVIAHIINDDEEGRALANAKLTYRIKAKDGRECCRGELILPPVPYFAVRSETLALHLPADLRTGEYLLSGNIVTASGIRSTNSVELFIAGNEWKVPGAKLDQPVFLYDPIGRTAAALARAGIEASPLTDLSSWPAQASALIIGEGAWDKPLAARQQALQRFVRDGGRILCLQQEPQTFGHDWLPVGIEVCTNSANDTEYGPQSRPFREQMNVNPERMDHPVFRGLDRYRFGLWSDYTGWDQTKPGFPKVYPVTAGFKLNKSEALARTAILADYDRGLEGIALCEMFDGAGSVVLSGFDLVSRVGLDPAADRLLANLVAYAASRTRHDIHPLIERPIRWGDFPSERGTICGPLNGLPVNADWLVPPTNPRARPLRPNTGSWNMAPGDQFVPRGRNPFGAFGYSNISSFKDLSRDATTGSGFFWARIPDGKRVVVTKVRNPTSKAGELTIAINEKVATGPVTLSAGQTVDFRSLLPAGVADVSVRYTGTKTLVLLETSFQ